MSSIGFIQNDAEPVVCSTQTVHLSCVKISTVSKWAETHRLVVPSGVSKMICKPMVHLAQTMQLFCIDTYTVSKRREVRFHMTHVN